MLKLLIIGVLLLLILGYWQGGTSLKDAARKGIGAGCGLGFIALVVALILFLMLFR